MSQLIISILNKSGPNIKIANVILLIVVTEKYSFWTIESIISVQWGLENLNLRVHHSSDKTGRASRLLTGTVDP